MRSFQCDAHTNCLEVAMLYFSSYMGYFTELKYQSYLL
jgi:hypothetical protein